MSATHINRANTFWQVTKQAFQEWLDDGAPRLGAAMSFYSILSLAPLLLISIAVAGWLVGEEAARGELLSQIQGMVGVEGGKAIEAMIKNAHHLEGGIIATLLGVIALLFGASGVFVELKHAMNIIWDVEPTPNDGLWGFVRTQLLSFAMVIAVGFLLLVSLVVSAVLAALTGSLQSRMPLPGWAAETINLAVSLGVYTLLFALIFKVIPDVKIAWRDVCGGTAATAALFALGRYAIGLYLGRAGIGSAYGAGGSLVVLLVWIFYSSQIVFFGAELTQVISRRKQTATPNPTAPALA